MLLLALAEGCEGSPSPVATSSGGGGAGVTGDAAGTGGSHVAAVTWTGDVADIVERHCVRCHAAGRLGAISPLQTHAQAYELSSLIAVKVEGGSDWGTQMPPFPGGVIPGVCEPEHAYSNDLRLPPADQETILAWVAAGAPEGPHPREPLVAPRAAPLAASTTYPFEEGYVVRIDAEEPGGHKDEYVCVVFDPGVTTEERLLTGLHVVADDPHLFWGAVVWLDPGRESLQHLDPASTRPHGDRWYECGDGFGFEGTMLGAFLPEGAPITTPARSAIAVPGDALYVARIHYHSHYANGDPGDTTPLPPSLEWRDHTPLRLRWASAAEIDHRAELLTFGNEDGPVVDGTGSLTPPFEVPPLASGHVESMVTTVPGTPDDTYQVWLVQSELGAAGTSAAVTLGPATAAPAECLAAHPAWNVAWQLPMTYDASSGAAPIARGGDTLRIDCTYDTPDPSLAAVDASCRATVGLLRVETP